MGVLTCVLHDVVVPNCYCNLRVLNKISTHNELEFPPTKSLRENVIKKVKVKTIRD